MPKTALLAGATGLIGSQLLPLLLNSERYDKVIVVGRRALVHWPADGCFYEGEFSAYQGDCSLPGDG